MNSTPTLDTLREMESELANRVVGIATTRFTQHAFDCVVALRSARMDIMLGHLSNAQATVNDVKASLYREFGVRI